MINSYCIVFQWKNKRNIIFSSYNPNFRGIGENILKKTNDLSMRLHSVEERECEFTNTPKAGTLNHFERYWSVFNLIFSLTHIKLTIIKSKIMIVSKAINHSHVWISILWKDSKQTMKWKIVVILIPWINLNF